MRGVLLLGMTCTLSAAALAACDDDSGDGGGDGTTIDAAPPVSDAATNPFEPPPAGGQQLVTEEYTLQPGEEKYFCYTFRSPADAEKGIVAIKQLSGQLVHHAGINLTTVAEPEGVSVCEVLFKLSWRPLWGSGAGSNSITLPQGTAFKVPANSQYVVQYHLQNTTEQAITERSALNLTYADPAPLQPVGIFAMGNFGINIPKDAMNFEQGGQCNSEHDVTVFSVMPHMHKIGTKVSLEHGPTEATATKVYELNPWVFGDQPFDPMALEVKKGDFLRTRCTYDNTTGQAVAFGEGSDDEMCFFVLYAYPLPEAVGCGL